MSVAAFYPTGVDAQGNETVIFVPALANVGAPTVAELTGASAINLSCVLAGFEPNEEQASVPDIRLCSREQYEAPGRITVTLNDITYIYDPQGAVDDPMNIHYRTLKPGTRGHLIDRRGLDARTAAVAATQLVDVYTVQFGSQRRVAIDPSAEGGKFQIIQKPFVVGPGAKDVAVAAA